MPYTTDCPSCGGGRYYRAHACEKCGGSGQVDRFRKNLSHYDLPAGTLILAWPKYGETGKCQCCGAALTGRRKTRCGNRECDALIWKRLYVGVHWMKRHCVVRDGCMCADCGSEFMRPLVQGGPVYPLPLCLELDHVIPLIDGGEDLPENWQLLCPECHRVKTSREARARAGNRGCGQMAMELPEPQISQKRRTV